MAETKVEWPPSPGKECNGGGGGKGLFNSQQCIMAALGSVAGSAWGYTWVVYWHDSRKDFTGVL